MKATRGAGKSALVRLLCRLYEPDSRSLVLDETGIRHLDPAEYRKLFSVVFQDFMLYNPSAGENIRMGNTEKDDPAVNMFSAATLTGIAPVI